MRDLLRQIVSLEWFRDSSNRAALAAFLLVAGAVYIVLSLCRRLGRDPIHERLAAATRDAAAIDNGEGQRKFLLGLTESLAGQLPQTKADNGVLDQDLRRAGFYKPAARIEFLAIRNFLVLFAVVVTGGLAVWLGPKSPGIMPRIVLGGLAVAGLAWGLPRIYLRLQGSRRVDRIGRSLPDALDMITMCLTGGLSLQDSLAHASRELFIAHPDLAVELIIIRLQANMMSLEQAFQQFSRRIDSPDILSMTALVSQAQRLGTDVVSSIHDFADGIRAKRRHGADEWASKAAVKLLFPVVLCLVPSVFLLLWGPALLELGEFVRTFQFLEPQ